VWAISYFIYIFISFVIFFLIASCCLFGEIKMNTYVKKSFVPLLLTNFQNNLLPLNITVTT